LLVTYDVDIYSVKEMLGHKTIHMAMHYAKVVDAKKKADAMKLPVLVD
jgi:hypothetical protein